MQLNSDLSDNFDNRAPPIGAKKYFRVWAYAKGGLYESGAYSKLGLTLLQYFRVWAFSKGAYSGLGT